MLGLFAADPGDQARQCSARAADEDRQSLEIVGAEERETVGSDELRLDFVERAARLTEELTPLPVGEPSLPLGNLTDRTDRRAAELRRQAKPLLGGKPSRYFVNRHGDIKRALKRDEIMK